MSSGVSVATAAPRELSDDELPRALANSIPAMLAYWDAEQRCRFANRAYERWFGVTPEWLIGRHISELLGPVYELNLPYIEAVLRGEPQQFERELPDPAGGPSRHALASYIPHFVGGVVRGWFVMVTDISEIKRAQLALLESEERFRLTIDEAPIGMAVVAPDGRFARVNRVLCEIVGYTAEELTGLTFQSITHPDDLDVDVALAGQLARGEIPRYDLAKRYVRRDGTIVDVMLSGSVVRGRDGAPLYFIAQIQDITERKRLEDELRLAEARSSGILSISADAIVSIDERQRITMFNEGAERMFGYTRGEVLGAPLELLMPERARALHRRHVEAFAAGLETARQMGRHGMTIVGLRKNGQEFPADAAISKLRVGGTSVLTVVLRDVSEQKRTEHEQSFLAEVGPVLASSLDYEQTLTTVAELAVRELADLCIVDVVEDGDEVRRLKVATRDPSKQWLCELLTRSPVAPGHQHLLSRVLRTMQPVLMQRPSVHDLAALATDQEDRWALRAAEIESLMAVPLLAQGGVVGALAFISSRPSRRYGAADLRLAAELAQRAALSISNARLYREARRATRLRDEVLGVVAHDLRNPLNSIVMQAALLRLRSGQSESAFQKSAERIERAAMRMNRLIQDLLDVTRLEGRGLAVERERVAAGAIVSDCVEAQRPLAAAAGLELCSELRQDLPDVWADRDRLLQVLENLIGNAVKFTAAGGRVSVGAGVRGGDVLFCVSDTGKGITADHLPHLFDRFWQAGASERRSGAGLGLAIVKGVVEAHGGRIWVESTPGRGSTFFFTIPVAPRLAHGPADHAAEQPLSGASVGPALGAAQRPRAARLRTAR